MKTTILYGTESGNAEECAEAIAKELNDPDAVVVHDMADVGPEVLEEPGFYVFITSTFGEGELPEGTDSFVTALKDASPDLSHLEFAVFGLGDSFYEETFNQGSRTLADELAAHGGKQLGEVGCYDTTTGEPHEDYAVEWFQGLGVLQEA